MASMWAWCHIKQYQVIKNYFQDNKANLKLIHEHGVLPTEGLCKLCN